LATSHQHGNALTGVRHQEKEEMTFNFDLLSTPVFPALWNVCACFRIFPTFVIKLEARMGQSDRQTDDIPNIAYYDGLVQSQ